MKFARRFLLTLAVSIGLSGAAAAQDDKDALKKDILRKVEQRLKQEEDRILKEIEKIIDEELSKPENPPVAKKKARGFLGIRPEDLTEDEKKGSGVEHGFRIAGVVEESPAEKAGLKEGDVILSIDGRKMESAQDAPALIQAAGAGAILKIEYLRDGKKKTVEATLARLPNVPGEAPKKEEPQKKEAPRRQELRERMQQLLKKVEPEGLPFDENGLALDESMYEQLEEMLSKLGVDPGQFLEQDEKGKYRLSEPYGDMLKGLFKGSEPETPKQEKPWKNEPSKPAPKGTSRPWLGIHPEELSEEARAKLDLEDGVGLVAGDVVEESPAAKAGLKKDDVLLELDGKPVKGEETLAKFMQSAKAGQEVKVKLLRRSKEVNLTVTLGERKE